MGRGRKMSCKEVSERVSRWTNITKIIMGVCFSILFVLGMVLFIAAAVALGGFNVFDTLGIYDVKAVITFALCLGLFIAIVSILGALGYFTLNRVMLIIFVCGIAILIVLEIVCGAVAFSYKNNFRNITETAWNDYVQNDTNATKLLEDTFGCCGSYDPSDAVPSNYCNVTNFTFGGLMLNDLQASESKSHSNEGCISVIAKKLTDNINSVCIGDIVITILEIIVIVVTAIVLYQVKNANSYKQFQEDPTLESIRD